MWNGSSWVSLGSGINGGINALIEYKEKLFTWGDFTVAGGKVSPYLAMWTYNYPPLSVEDTGHDTPAEFSLSQNYPNPFNPMTTISYKVSERTGVSLKVFNSLGQPIRSLVDSEQPTGSYSVKWDCRDDYGRPVGNGVYHYRMEAGGFIQSKKAVILK